MATVWPLVSTTWRVSIPMTVLGGLQHINGDYYDGNSDVFQYR